MSLKNFQSGLQSLLLADTGLIGWLETHFGAGTTFTPILSNRPVAHINTNEMPGLVFEIDDGESSQVVGNYKQDNDVVLNVAVGWHENDPDKAFVQRAELADLMIAAVMQDHTLSGQVAGCWVEGFRSDKNVNHPKHFMTFDVRGEYGVTP